MHSNTGYIMTVANSIIGVGILAMPFCFMKCGILLSIVLLILSNLVTRIACHYLLKTAIKVRRKNFEFLASYLFGSSGKLMVELCVIGYLMGTCITYFVVVGDLGPQIIAKIFDIKETNSLRTTWMILVTVFCIIPLGLLRNIESLSSVCISSILFYFCLVLKIFFESDSKISSMYWHENVYWWRPSGITQCLPIFSMALSCQMQLFEIYESLPNQTLEKMSEIIKYGTAICTGVYILVGFFGYVAFSDQKFSGNILMSLSPSLASDIIKVGFVLSVAVSFPLVIFPCRASLYSLLYHRSHSETSHYIPEHRFKYITVSLILVSLIIGILIPSIELVIGLVGSTIGVAICIMFPASCFIKTNKKNSTEKLTAQFLLVFGFLIMILGTYANLGAIDEQQSGAELPLDKKPDIFEPEKPEIPTKFDKPIFEPNVNKDIPPDNLKPDDSELNVKTFKRKPIKLSKTQSNGIEPVREIKLENVEEKNVEVKKAPEPVNPFPQPDEPKIPKIESPILKPNIVVQKENAGDQQAQNVLPNQLPEPAIKEKQADTMINKDAIQKEEQEIAIDANEHKKVDIEQTKQQILAEVKNELVNEMKQNEAAQKLVLEKIDKISQQVNNIEKMQLNELRQETAEKKIDDDKSGKGTAVKVENKSNLNEAGEGNHIDQLKKLPDPVQKLLDPKMNLSKGNVLDKPESKLSSVADTNANISPKLKPIVVEAPVHNFDKSKAIPKDTENIGRDLLSDTVIDVTNGLPKNEPNQSIKNDR